MLSCPPCPPSGACTRARLCLPHTGTSAPRLQPHCSPRDDKQPFGGDLVQWGFGWRAYPPEALCFKFMPSSRAHGAPHCWGAGQEWGAERSLLPVVTEAWFEEGRDRTRQSYVFPRALYSKPPQIWWLETTRVYSQRVLEAGGLKSRCQQGLASSDSSEMPALPLSVSRDFLVSRSPTPISASVFTGSSSLCPSVSSLLIRTAGPVFRAYPKSKIF